MKPAQTKGTVPPFLTLSLLFGSLLCLPVPAAVADNGSLRDQVNRRVTEIMQQRSPLDYVLDRLIPLLEQTREYAIRREILRRAAGESRSQ